MQLDQMTPEQLILHLFPMVRDCSCQQRRKGCRACEGILDILIDLVKTVKAARTPAAREDTP